MRQLGERGLTYDTWHYHYQNREFVELARAVPDTIIVLDHFGTPLGVGPYAGTSARKSSAVAHDITDIAACPNVFAKLGGLAMPDNGFGWNTASARRPRGSSSPRRSAITCTRSRRLGRNDACSRRTSRSIGSRCRIARCGTGLKLNAGPYSASEHDQMFCGTAATVYRI